MGNPSQSSNAGPSTAWGQPYSPPAKQHSSILLHQCLSFPLNALLYTTATPFSPLAWILGPHEGAFLFDRFAGGIILLSALYFQFKLASRTHAVVVTVPNPLAQPETYVREGRLQRARWGPEFVFLTWSFDVLPTTGCISDVNRERLLNVPKAIKQPSSSHLL
ncbi:hypothetical protein GRF29_19g144397 [Pseudopithomyces chartarum]|uniref:Uncharacterized protein n=1 Tax=Pseudopithomyces chartarum TaxID=1892770 RepID=A0AAN6M584_9PLEO|nr:hypothetical protein GRF29_19g144397 [Pseudopithomyces chartarum]